MGIQYLKDIDYKDYEKYLKLQKANKKISK